MSLSGTQIRSALELDFLEEYSDWIDWSVRAGTIPESRGRGLRKVALAQIEAAERTLVRAKGVRRTLYDIFSRLAHGRGADASDLTALNLGLAPSLAQVRVKKTPGGFTWGWDDQAEDLERLLWPLIRSAAEMLTSPELKRLRQCDGDNCTWLFLDRSKNRSRRWCDMDVCGNRAKSKRHYARTRRT